MTPRRWKLIDFILGLVTVDLLIAAVLMGMLMGRTWAR